MQIKKKFSIIIGLFFLLSANISAFSVEPKTIEMPGKKMPPGQIEKIYAPVLYFDSKEKAPLTSVETYLKTGVSLIGYKGGKKYKIIKRKVKRGDLEKYQSRFINPGKEKLELALQTENKISPPENIVYTRSIKKNNYIFVQYWFFYSFNDVSDTGGNEFIHKCGNHQADWEHISLKINSDKFINSKNENDYINSIEEIFFAQHNKGQHDERKNKKAHDKSVSFEGTHIKAFPARGTHATFYEAGEYNIADILVLRLNDFADGKGKVLNSENFLSDIESYSWSKYGGRWGQISDDYCNIAEVLTKASNDGELGPLQQLPGTDWDK